MQLGWIRIPILWALLSAPCPPAAGGAPPHAGTKPEKTRKESQDFFDGPVRSIELTLPETSIAALIKEPKALVRGNLTEGSRVYSNVGVRLKGSAGSFQPLEGNTKPGFTIKMNQFARDQRFHGMRKITLNNGVQDPSYLSELIGNELFRAAGVPAARACHAHLSLNGRDLGLHIVVEGVSRDFLELHFKDSTGTVYEGPGDLGDDLDIDSRGGSGDRADLRELKLAAEEKDKTERIARIKRLLDLDRFMSFLAMESLTWNWDGYSVGVNNYRIYHDPASNWMVFLPHGCDQLFQDPTGPLLPAIQGLLARAVLDTSEGRRLFKEKVTALHEKLLKPGAVLHRVEELGAKVNAALLTASPDEAKAHQEAVANLIERIKARSRSIEEQLAQPDTLFGAPIAFDVNGEARPANWQPRVDAGQPAVAQSSLGSDKDEKKSVLEIRSNEEGKNIASWRAKVLLLEGRYRFVGRVKAKGVSKLPASEDESRASGVCLRISGHEPKNKFLGDTDGWMEMSYEFQVGDGGPAAEGSVPSQVQLVCELRGAKGEVAFELESLKIVRAPAVATEKKEERES